jgi:Fe-S-cluster-containing hydrogenase component 2
MLINVLVAEYVNLLALMYMRMSLILLSLAYLCQDVCPTGAISRDSNTSAIVVDETKCIGCRMCIMACPFGGISLHPEKHVVIKCDLCEGDPACVKYCPIGAIKYERLDKVGLALRRVGAERLSELISIVSRR